MSDLSLIRPDMRAIVGQPYGVVISYPVTSSDIRRWAQAVYYPQEPPAVYLDPEAAADGRLSAQFDFNAFAWGAARSVPTGKEIEAHPKYRAVGAMEQNLGVTPPDLVRALNGGVWADYTGVCITPGDVITGETVITGYTEREGRLGPMLITDTTSTWLNQDGETVRTSGMSLIRY